MIAGSMTKLFQPMPGVWLVLIPLAAILGACSPSIEDCRNLMPVETTTAVPAPTPAATRGCKAELEGVTIQVEAVRRNLRWEKGRIWIEGVETPEIDVSSSLAARARHAATDFGTKVRQTVQGIGDAAKSVRDSLHGKPEPPKPPPPPQ
jgi:hypothetical protein